MTWRHRMAPQHTHKHTHTQLCPRVSLRLQVGNLCLSTFYADKFGAEPERQKPSSRCAITNAAVMAAGRFSCTSTLKAVTFPRPSEKRSNSVSPALLMTKYQQQSQSGAATKGAKWQTCWTTMACSVFPHDIKGKW